MAIVRFVSGEGRWIAGALACVLAPLAVASGEARGEIVVEATADGVTSTYLANMGPKAVQPPPEDTSVSAPVDAAPPPAPPLPAPARTFSLQAGEVASEVFKRWLAEDGVQLVWLAPGDYRLDAAARFRAASAVDAVRSISEILGRMHPDLFVEEYDNDVVVVKGRS